MDAEDLGGNFVLAVDELGVTGLWTTIKDILEARIPLTDVTISNKLGKAVSVSTLSVTYVLSTDKRLLRLKPFSHSPVTWFRNPYAYIILVSTADVNEYRSVTRNQIKKAATDIEREWSGEAVSSEWIILYVRPFELDVQDKAAKRVFEKIREEFSSKKRERCVRLDIPLRAYDASGNKVQAEGLEEYDMALKDCIRASFDSRQTAYDNEVKKLLNERLDPKWSFTHLYLVKDSFALMVESAGLYEEALREYLELETVYLEALNRGALPPMEFGANVESEDYALMLTASWRSTRRSVLKKGGAPEFQFRQYLFAAQARLLLKLSRTVEVAQRGLSFIESFVALLTEKEGQGGLRKLVKECWAFSACMAVISTATALAFRPQVLSTEWDLGDLMLGPKGKDVQARDLMGTKGVGDKGTRSGTRDVRDDKGDRKGAGPPMFSQPLVDWNLGMAPPDITLLDLESRGLGGQATIPASNSMGAQELEERHRQVRDKQLHAALGQLYDMARGELLKLGAALGLRTAADKRDGAGRLQSSRPMTQGEVSPSRTTPSDLRPPLRAHLQAFMKTPLCGFSQLLWTPEQDMRQSGVEARPDATAVDGTTDEEKDLPAPDQPMQALPVPSWINDWRLKLALSDATTFEDLVLCLSRLAAWCFSLCGRRRTSALICADIAAVMVVQGQTARACELLEMLVRALTAEGSHYLLSWVLPKLVACQHVARQVHLPLTCLRYLSLPEEVVVPSREDCQEAVFSELMSLELGRGHLGGTWCQQLPAMQALQVRPMVGASSYFYGGTHCGVSPTLIPPAHKSSSSGLLDREHSSPRGATLVVVGDSIRVTVDVVSGLPGPVVLEELTLVLGRRDWRSEDSEAGDWPGSWRQSAEHLDTAPGGLPGRALRPPTLLIRGDLEEEDLLCPLLGPVDESLRPTTTPDNMEPEPACSATQAAASCQLVPGVNHLQFLVIPQEEGLYVINQVVGRIEGVEVVILPMGEQEVEEPTSMAPPLTPESDGAATRNPGPGSLGCVGLSGDIRRETVVMQVQAPAQRVSLLPVAPCGSLIGGQKQWLGLIVSPLHEPLTRARLCLRTKWYPGGSRARAGLVKSTGQEVPHMVDLSECKEVYIMEISGEGPTLGAPKPPRHDTRASVSEHQEAAASSGGEGSIPLANTGCAGVRLDDPVEDPVEQRDLAAHSGGTPAEGSADLGPGVAPQDVSEDGGQGPNALEAPTSTSSDLPQELEDDAGSTQTPGASDGRTDDVLRSDDSPRIPPGLACDGGGTEQGGHAGGSVDLDDELDRGGRWVRMHNGVIQLWEGLPNGGPMVRPLVVWMQVYVHHLDQPTSTVRVTRKTADAMGRLKKKLRSTSGTSGLEVGTPTALSIRGGPPFGRGVVTAEVDVCTEYLSGCWRSHSQRLSVPVRPALTVIPQAYEMPGNCLLLCCQLRSDPQLTVRVLSCQLSLNYAIRARWEVHSQYDLLPMNLPPGSSGNVSFFFQPMTDFSNPRLSNSDPGCVKVSYQILSGTLSSGPLAEPVLFCMDVQGPEISHLQHLNSLVGSSVPGGEEGRDSHPPGAQAASTTANCPGDLDAPIHHIRQGLALSWSSARAAEGQVFVKLLGPFLGKVGSPLPLTWRVVRRGSAPPVETTSPYWQQPSNGLLATMQRRSGAQGVYLGEITGEGDPDGSTAPHQEQLTQDSLHDDPNEMKGEEPEDVSHLEGPRGHLSPARPALQMFSDSFHHHDKQYEQLVYRVLVGTDEDDNPEEGIPGGDGSGALWRRLLPQRGAVKLGRALGSMSTIEVLVVPLVTGYLPPPELVIDGVEQEGGIAEGRHICVRTDTLEV